MNNEMTKDQLLDRVTESNRQGGNPRVQQIAARIIGDLFKAIDELNVTPDEFWAGVHWLERLGHTRQIGLITAGLGFDRLLDILSDEADERAGRLAGTPRAIEGPLYIPGAPLARYEVKLDADGAPNRGETMVMEGRVVDLDGKPIAGAIVDVWHANELGRYSHFDPDQPEYALRRRIETDSEGRYRYRSFIPPGYAIPPDSPTSELFTAIGRHGNRPAHIHILVTAPGMRTLTTQVNVPGDSFIDDDFAFATRDGLILTLEKGTSPKGYESLGVTSEFTRVPFDFQMQPAADADEASPESRMARVAA